MELRGNLRFFLLRHYCQREIRSVGETCRYISVVPYLASGCADKVLTPATFPIFPSFQPRCFSSNCVKLKLDIANNRFPVLVYKIHYISKKTYRKLNCEVKRVCYNIVFKHTSSLKYIAITVVLLKILALYGVKNMKHFILKITSVFLRANFRKRHSPVPPLH